MELVRQLGICAHCYCSYGTTGYCGTSPVPLPPAGDRTRSAAGSREPTAQRRTASSEMLVTPYFWVALSACSDTNRYALFSRHVSTSNPAASIASR